MQLITKNFRPWVSVDQIGQTMVFGRSQSRQIHNNALAQIRQRDYQDAPPAAVRRPVLVGEIGIAFDYERDEGTVV